MHATADAVPSVRMDVCAQRLLEAHGEHTRTNLGITMHRVAGPCPFAGTLCKLCGNKAPLLLPKSAALQAEVEAALAAALPSATCLTEPPDTWTVTVSGGRQATFAYGASLSEFVASALAAAASMVFAEQVARSEATSSGSSAPVLPVSFLLFQVTRTPCPPPLDRHPVVFMLRVFPSW